MLTKKSNFKALLVFGLLGPWSGSLYSWAADGPDFYVRGDFEGCSWQSNDFLMNKDGNHYSIHLDRINGQFKITTPDWGINYGADSSKGSEITSSCYYKGVFGGPNFSGMNLQDVNISFDYVDNSYADIKFVIQGIEPGQPVDPIDPPVDPTDPPVDDSDYPVFYIRGDFSNCSWTSIDFPMKRVGDNYSITLTNLSGQFKITNEDWTINFGTSGESIRDLVGSCYAQGIKDGPNFAGNNINELTISFDYAKGSNEAKIKFVVNGVEPGDDPSPSYNITNNYISGTLPVLYINVYDEFGNLNNEINSKDLAHKDYFSGEYWLDLNGCQWMEAEGAQSIGSREEPLSLEIKARGNYTRTAYAKKPFKLKLGKKQSLLGMTKSKHFAILAHADDTFGYLRNFTGFNLGKRIELPWTPAQQPVEVVINGDYRGLYFLTESIRVDEERVNITELGDNVSDPALASGGYLVELDNYDEENQIRMEEKGPNEGFRDTLRITFDTPEEYSDLQRMFVEQQFRAMNDAVGDISDRLWAYMDLDDAARYYIVEEILCHTEAYHGSTYLFRDFGENQKWHFSPLWDCGNAFNGSTDNYFTSGAPWGNTWIYAIRQNGKFQSKVKDTWKWFMSQKFDGLYQDIDSYIEHLKKAADSDYKRWNNQPVPNGGLPVVDNRDLDSRKERVKNHLNGKINWLKSQFGDYSNSYFAEPQRDDTPAAQLPSFIMSSVEEINDLIENSDSEVMIFTLDGMRVSTPEQGKFYIIVRDGKADKTLIK